MSEAPGSLEHVTRQAACHFCGRVARDRVPASLDYERYLLKAGWRPAPHSSDWLCPGCLWRFQNDNIPGPDEERYPSD